MKKFLSLYLLIFLIIPVSTFGGEAASPAKVEVTISEFVALYKKNKVSQLIDVRSKKEFKKDGSIHKARWIALSELSSKGESAVSRLNKKRALYVISRSGNHSLVAVSILKKLGFHEVYSVKGGITAWILLGGEIKAKTRNESK